MQTIGSIVYLKDGRQKIMILNRTALYQTETRQVRFDYSGCLYPIGLNPDQIFYFNEENIDKVVFEGYHDEEEDRFRELFKQWESEEGSRIPKGHIKQNEDGSFNIE